jgi:hypothetical protein
MIFSNLMISCIFFYLCLIILYPVKTILFALFVMLSADFYAQNADNLQAIDSRARKYYADSDIINMTPVKLAQVNFIFQRSFVINHDKPCPECPEVDLNKVDVGVLQRQVDKRKRHYQSVPGHPIDLLSIQELDAELLRIEQELNTNSNSH